MTVPGFTQDLDQKLHDYEKQISELAGGLESAKKNNDKLAAVWQRATSLFKEVNLFSQALVKSPLINRVSAAITTCSKVKDEAEWIDLSQKEQLVHQTLEEFGKSPRAVSADTYLKTLRLLNNVKDRVAQRKTEELLNPEFKEKLQELSEKIKIDTQQHKQIFRKLRPDVREVVTNEMLRPQHPIAGVYTVSARLPPHEPVLVQEVVSEHLPTIPPEVSTREAGYTFIPHPDEMDREAVIYEGQANAEYIFYDTSSGKPCDVPSYKNVVALRPLAVLPPPSDEKKRLDSILQERFPSIKAIVIPKTLQDLFYIYFHYLTREGVVSDAQMLEYHGKVHMRTIRLTNTATVHGAFETCEKENGFQNVSFLLNEKIARFLLEKKAEGKIKDLDHLRWGEIAALSDELIGRIPPLLIQDLEKRGTSVTSEFTSELYKVLCKPCNMNRFLRQALWAECFAPPGSYTVFRTGLIMNDGAKKVVQEKLKPYSLSFNHSLLSNMHDIEGTSSLSSRFNLPGTCVYATHIDAAAAATLFAIPPARSFARVALKGIFSHVRTKLCNSPGHPVFSEGGKSDKLYNMGFQEPGYDTIQPQNYQTFYITEATSLQDFDIGLRDYLKKNSVIFPEPRIFPRPILTSIAFH